MTNYVDLNFPSYPQFRIKNHKPHLATCEQFRHFPTIRPIEVDMDIEAKATFQAYQSLPNKFYDAI